MRNKILSTAILALIAVGAFGQPVIPKPVKQELLPGEFSVNQATYIVAPPELSDLAGYMNDFLKRSLVVPLRVSSGDMGGHNQIRLTLDASLPSEGYVLDVTQAGIGIRGGDYGGVFYGVQTLFQLMPPEVYAMGYTAINIRCQRVEDRPAMKYRGVMLDVARTFTPLEGVKRFVDLLSRHKINTFHWHLTDDEGWRIEIKKYPELTRIGGYRGGDSPVKPIYGEWDKKYGGYYTQEEIRELVRYAAVRNIEVIPEIDLPGHSRTAAKVYPHILCRGTVNTAASGDDRRNVWCASKEDNFRMLDAIIGEVAALFPSKYLNVGGDEVESGPWRNCPDCQALMRKKGISTTGQMTDYFMERLRPMLESRGKVMGVWDEAASSGKLTRNSCVYAWRNVKEALAATSKGYETVVMAGSYLYIDMKQSPYEDGLTWAGVVPIHKLYSFDPDRLGFTETRKRHLAGIQAGFWAELLLSHTPDYLYYQTYPRICAVAEVGWSEGSARSWDDFYGRLTGAHLARLSHMGVPYRQFPPVADYSSGVITVSAPFDGAEIRYTDDGSRPNEGSRLYTGPVGDDDPGRYLFRAFYMGNGSHAVAPAARRTWSIKANSSETFSFKVSDMADRAGVWFIRCTPTGNNVKINRINVRTPQRTYNIIASTRTMNPMHVMRFYAADSNITGTMNVTVTNSDPEDCRVEIALEPSPYIEPKVKITSSMGGSTSFPWGRAEDYNASTYSRSSRTCKKGDHILFTFERPVDAYSIEVFTGLSYLPRYHIPDGRVELSYDGVKFAEAGELSVGKATVYPVKPVKAVRVVSDSDGNSENAVAVQDLRIKPRKQG